MFLNNDDDDDVSERVLCARLVCARLVCTGCMLILCTSCSAKLRFYLKCFMTEYFLVVQSVVCVCVGVKKVQCEMTASILL